MEIVFIDNKAKNLRSWLAAMEPICREEANLVTYRSVDEFEEALEEGYEPNIVFTDYNINDRFGTEVLEMLRQRFGRKVYIIAHSSDQYRNEYLLRLGADEIIPKYKKVFPSPTLGDRFWSVDDLKELYEGRLEEE